MKTIEEKAAALTERWKELHKEEKAEAPEKPRKPRTELKVDSSRPKYKSYLFPEDFFAALRPPPRENDEDPIKIPEGVKNESILLRDIKEPVTWFGNVAAAPSRQFKGWWMVVAPNGISISFFGSGAQERAFEEAKRLEEYYK